MSSAIGSFMRLDASIYTSVQDRYGWEARNVDSSYVYVVASVSGYSKEVLKDIRMESKLGCKRWQPISRQ